MLDVLDVHSHTLVSGHAYSTIQEMAAAAAGRGLEVLGITEHAPAMPGSCHLMYFQNMKVLDRHAYDVEILFGAELNLLDEEGTVDLPEELLQKMDLTIASLHTPCMAPLSEAGNTAAVVRALENPWINVIGHLDDSRFPVNYGEIAHAASENHTLLEINNSSLLPTSFRKNARENNLKLLEWCARLKVPVVVNSDAHADIWVGRHEEALGLLEEAGFPEELVVNRSYRELKKYINRFKDASHAAV